MTSARLIHLRENEQGDVSLPDHLAANVLLELGEPIPGLVKEEEEEELQYYLPPPHPEQQQLNNTVPLLQNIEFQQQHHQVNQMMLVDQEIKYI
jgi:hypothetical protein